MEELGTLVDVVATGSMVEVAEVVLRALVAVEAYVAVKATTAVDKRHVWVHVGLATVAAHRAIGQVHQLNLLLV